MSYPSVYLGELIRANYGKALKKGERDESGSWDVFGSSGLVGKHSETLTTEATIIIGRKGSVGAITYASNGGWTIDTAFYVDILDNEKLNLRYLYYALNNSGLDRHTITTSIPGINRDNIYGTKIPLPPLPEQRRIAAILDKADAIRRKRQQAIRLTEEFLRSVFLDMFGDPVLNPKGWPQVPIRELGTVTTGNTPPRQVEVNYGDYIEWIKSDNINKPQHYLTKSKEMLSEKGAAIGRVVPRKSILVTCIAGSPACIGNAALADRDVAFNQQINALTPNPEVNPYFLYAQLLVAKKHVQRASTESMKGMISKGKFQEIQFLKPPADLQEKYGEFFEKYLSFTLKSSGADLTGTELFNSLVQRAFKGELLP